MKSKEIIVSQFAEDDLNEIADYYFSLSPEYVGKVISDFEKNLYVFDFVLSNIQIN